jgi:hypothetical protein
VRPWVWIGWIALAPLLLDLNDQFYTYMNVRHSSRSFPFRFT